MKFQKIENFKSPKRKDQTSYADTLWWSNQYSRPDIRLKDMSTANLIEAKSIVEEWANYESSDALGKEEWIGAFNAVLNTRNRDEGHSQLWQV